MRIKEGVIEKAMAKKCLSTKDLAMATGLGITTVTKIKMGKYSVLRAKTVGLIAKCLELDVEQIVE